MRKFCWVTILYLLIVGTSCQKEVADTKRPVVIEKSESANGQRSAIMEAAAIEETIKELQQQGLIQ